MISRALVTFAISIAVSCDMRASTGTAQVDKQSSELLARVMVSAPRPDYPVAARARHITGHGVYDIRFHTETGLVSDISITHSTGSKLLDDAALRALRKWRARPGVVNHMTVPLTFSM